MSTVLTSPNSEAMVDEMLLNKLLLMPDSQVGMYILLQLFKWDSLF